MKLPIDNFNKNISELKRFAVFAYELEPAKKLADLIKKCRSIGGYWDLNWESLKVDTAEWKEFNQRFNSFIQKDVTNSSRYLSIGGDKLYDHTEIIGQQLLVMIVSVLEVYFTQQLLNLVRSKPLVYLENLQKNGEIKNIDINLLNRFKFQPGRIVEYLLYEGKIIYNMQNFDSVKKHFRYFNVNVPDNSFVENVIDIRHLVIHRLGRPDKKFLEKYGIEGSVLSTLSISKDFVDMIIFEVEKVVNKIEKEINNKSI